MTNNNSVSTGLILLAPTWTHTFGTYCVCVCACACVEKEKSPSTLRIVHTQLHKPRYKTYFAAANSLIKSIKFRVTTGLANYNIMRSIKRALFIVKLAAHCLICSTNYLRLLASSNNIRKHDVSIQWILKLFSCVLDYFL